MTNAVLKNRLNELKNRQFFKKLVIRRGIEKEFFRVNLDGFISKRPHPELLGSSLTNKFITTDFAEAQLELVTPVFEDIKSLYDFLYSLHIFVAQNIEDDEMLWPFSMPPKIKDESDINLGYYHQSSIGLLKHVYRKGLKVRYGPTMQCVSGMHYNFSVSPDSFSIFTQSDDQKVTDDAYLGLIRNFKKLYWFILSQFGQTNIVDKSFIKGRKHNLEKLNNEDMYLKDATSLRMSEIGYQSKAQHNLGIKYNSLEGFLNKTKKAITVPYPEFEKKGLKDSDGSYHQISDGIIQIENEYYDSIRPKRSASNNKDMRPYDLLKNFGIEYVEIRGIDLSPHDITGISKYDIKFLDLFLIYCLINDSPNISSEEKNLIDINDHTAIYYGKDDNKSIYMNGDKINIGEGKKRIFEDLKELAIFFDDSEEYLNSIEHVKNSTKGEMIDKTHHQNGLDTAKNNLDILKSGSNRNINSIKKEAELSLDKLNNLPTNSTEEMEEFVKNYNLNL
ncbi:MAG: glutamate--cysteine ligase [Gammaproteobacteria bacterium]|nr:glutamate--cysteine ligase [Gammaproteobacteria bacterium]|tara:strand:+ start:6099 stop:7610 length:1512 start_codon:yes stop_codon:yes gene_type:complete